MTKKRRRSGLLDPIFEFMGQQIKELAKTDIGVSLLALLLIGGFFWLGWFKAAWLLLGLAALYWLIWLLRRRH